MAWREVAPYSGDDDFIFASERRDGKTPIAPDMVLKKRIRKALKRAGIVGKVIGWHSFRHGLGTMLRQAGVDVKTAQETCGMPIPGSRRTSISRLFRQKNARRRTR
jgi:integrase